MGLRAENNEQSARCSAAISDYYITDHHHCHYLTTRAVFFSRRNPAKANLSGSYTTARKIVHSCQRELPGISMRCGLCGAALDAVFMGTWWRSVEEARRARSARQRATRLTHTRTNRAGESARDRIAAPDSTSLGRSFINPKPQLAISGRLSLSVGGNER